MDKIWRRPGVYQLKSSLPRALALRFQKLARSPNETRRPLHHFELCPFAFRIRNQLARQRGRRVV